MTDCSSWRDDASASCACFCSVMFSVPPASSVGWPAASRAATRLMVRCQAQRPSGRLTRYSRPGSLGRMMGCSAGFISRARSSGCTSAKKPSRVCTACEGTKPSQCKRLSSKASTPLAKSSSQNSMWAASRLTFMFLLARRLCSSKASALAWRVASSKCVSPANDTGATKPAATRPVSR